MASEVQAARREYYPQLTSVRFLAAFLVVLFHFDEMLPSLGPVAGGLIRHGYIGVSFFFILSGFIISANYFERFQHKKTSFKDFLWARFSRIYPLYLLSILIMLPRLVLQPGEAAMVWVKEHPIRAAISQIFAVQSFDLSTIELFNSPTWSISTEIFFYFCFPLVVPLLARLKARELTAAAVALFVLSAGLPYLYHSDFFPRNWPALNLGEYTPAIDKWINNTVRMNFLARLPEFLIGVVCFRLFLSWQRPEIDGTEEKIRDRLVGLWLVSLFAFVGILYANPDVKPVALYTGQLAGTPFFSASLLLLVQSKNGFTKWLSHPTWVLLGEASYALYLFHIPIKHMARVGYEKVTGAKLALSSVPVALAIIALAVLVSIPIFKFIETPVRKKLIGWYRGRQKRNQSAAEEPAVPQPIN